MDDKDPLFGIGIIIFLLIIKAMISHAKEAIKNLNEKTIRNNAEEKKDKESLLLLELIDCRPESYIYAIDLLITTISVMCGFVYYSMIYKKINELATSVGITHKVLEIIYNIFAVSILVGIVALFGSLLPKKLAHRNTEKKAYKNINMMMFIMKTLRPFTFVMQVLININLRLMSIDPKELQDNVTEEEIISRVTEGKEQGVFEENEVEMISNIMEFDEKQVKDIMTHRKNIVAIDVEMSVKEALNFMLSKNFSRFPLYKDEIDNIIGIVHIKDVAKCYVEMQENIQELSLEEISREPYFVPETQNIDVLFNVMQLNKTHMAIAVDEYGQTSGIIAFEDILEEIVGNIFDEYDEDEKTIIKQANGLYVMKGMAMLEEVEEELKISIDKEKHDTLNGLLISQLQRIPNENEKFVITFKGYTFEVLDVKNKMVRWVRVKKLKKEEAL